MEKRFYVFIFISMIVSFFIWFWARGIDFSNLEIISFTTQANEDGDGDLLNRCRSVSVTDVDWRTTQECRWKCKKWYSCQGSKSCGCMKD